MLGVHQERQSQQNQENHFATGETLLHPYFKCVCCSGLCILRQNRAGDRLELEKQNKTKKRQHREEQLK